MCNLKTLFSIFLALPHGNPLFGCDLLGLSILRPTIRLTVKLGSSSSASV